jgi:putative component of membrane protein insertase Oxa1/YidC/SpoIIIJ protein YidD
MIDKKLPMIIDKKGFMISITDITVLSIANNIVESKTSMDIKVSHTNRFGKYLPKKSIHLNALTKSIPKLQGKFLSFELLSFKMNRFIKIKEVKGILKKKIANIKMPIKKLAKMEWFASVKDIAFRDSGALQISLGISKLIIFLLLPLLLLREIGLFLITIYQKFFSARKGYTCAKGALYQKGTCSSTTKEAFRKSGFIAGIKEYRASTKKCKEAHKTIKNQRNNRHTSCGMATCSGCGSDSCALDSLGSSAGLCDGCSATPCDVASC